MKEKKVFRVAVLSDLHVSLNSEHTYLTNETPSNLFDNPVDSLIDFSIKNTLDADMLVCCGDMADAADANGQKIAWENIHKLANALKVSKSNVYGTVGNHDVDSRYITTMYDPKENLQKLAPNFPNSDESFCDRFWARHYAFSYYSFDNKQIRILNINSCAYHGSGNRDINEYEHGRISQLTLDKISQDLQQSYEKKDEFDLNIAVFHHHPIRWSTRSGSDYSEMDGGDKLIRLLSKSQYGSWFIIHGHKHWPNIKYADGSSNQPLIFAAGSFSSKNLPREKNESKNQFYIIEFEISPMQDYQLSIAGIVKSWNWSLGVGWNLATIGDGIPYEMGFGANTIHPSILACKINEYCADDDYYEWEVLQEKFPTLKFTLPKAIEDIIEILRYRYDFTIIKNEDNTKPLQLTKRERSKK